MTDANKSQPNLQTSLTIHNPSTTNIFTDQQSQLSSLASPSDLTNVAADHSTNDDNGAADALNEVNHGNHQQPAKIDKGVDEYFKSFPPGYRFCPTDIELIVHYLNKKIKNEKLPRHRIHEVNLYKYSPDKISEMYPVLGEKERYFFTPRDRKYSNGTRPNRAAGTGYWKATGADKAIRNNGSTIGFRKALVFYEGKPPKGHKSNWIMHEYRVNGQPRKKSCATDMRLDDYVLCRIYKKSDKSLKSRQRNVDHLYLNSQSDQDVQARTDFRYGNDDHMEDYSPLILADEVLEISHSQFEFPDISFAEEDITKYNGNHFQSFDYALGHTPTCFLHMPSINPISSSWNSKPKLMPMPPPVHSTANAVSRLYYLKEGAWDFEPKGTQKQIRDKTEKHFLPHDFDIHSISFVDPEVNLDTILNNNPSASPSKSPPIPKRQRD